MNSFSFYYEFFLWISFILSFFFFLYVIFQIKNPKKNSLIGLESLKLLAVVGFVITLLSLFSYAPFVFFGFSFDIGTILMIVNTLFLILHIIYWVKICKKKKAIKMFVERMKENQVKNSQPVKTNNGETQNPNTVESVQSASNTTVLPSNTPIPNYTKTKGEGEKSTTDLAALLTSVFTIPLEALIYFTNLETDIEWVSLWGSEEFAREVKYLPDETKTLMILLMVISLGASYFLIFRKGKNYSNKATWVKIINAINIIAGIVIIMLQ